MKTKIVLLAALAVSLSATTFAQQKTTFGIRAGVNFQNITGEEPITGDDVDFKIKPGFHAGFNAEIPVGIDFYLQPGVLFSTKGFKNDDNDTKLNLSYIEVPVNFIYKPTLGAGKLLLGFGPYVAFAAGGSFKPETGDDVDLKFKNEISANEFLSGQPYAKRIDAGANFLFGYQMSSNLSVQLNAGLGLVNISPKIENVDEDDSGKYKNVGFGLSLGYRF